MKRTWKVRLVTAAVGVAIAGAAVGIVWAATGYKIECLNAECGYKGTATLGSLRMSESIDGYCVACNKWVNVRWKRTGEKAPEPIGRVWVAYNGKTLPVYACPTCKGPFTPVTGDEMLKSSTYAPTFKPGGADKMMYCPKCGEPSLKLHTEMAID